MLGLGLRAQPEHVVADAHPGRRPRRPRPPPRRRRNRVRWARPAPHRRPSAPRRILPSSGLMLAAETLIRISPGPACGSGTSSTFSCSGPPYAWIRSARIPYPSPSDVRAIKLACRHGHSTSAVPRPGRAGRSLRRRAQRLRQQHRTTRPPGLGLGRRGQAPAQPVVSRVRRGRRRGCGQALRGGVRGGDRHREVESGRLRQAGLVRSADRRRARRLRVRQRADPGHDQGRTGGRPHRADRRRQVPVLRARAGGDDLGGQDLLDPPDHRHADALLPQVGAGQGRRAAADDPGRADRRRQQGRHRRHGRVLRRQRRWCRRAQPDAHLGRRPGADQRRPDRDRLRQRGRLRRPRRLRPALRVGWSAEERVGGLVRRRPVRQRRDRDAVGRAVDAARHHRQAGRRLRGAALPRDRLRGPPGGAVRVVRGHRVREGHRPRGGQGLREVAVDRPGGLPGRLLQLLRHPHPGQAVAGAQGRQDRLRSRRRGRRLRRRAGPRARQAVDARRSPRPWWPR